MRYRTVLLSLGLCLTATAALQAQDPMEKLIEQWESTFNAGDYAAAAALYTPDAIRYPPEQMPLRGREAIRDDMANYSDLTIELELTGSKSAGDLISSWGTYALYSKSGDTDAAVQSGPWMNVAVRGEDGSWMIHRDIWNVSAP